jgi:hypothetical protein
MNLRKKDDDVEIAEMIRHEIKRRPRRLPVGVNFHVDDEGNHSRPRLHDQIAPTVALTDGKEKNELANLQNHFEEDRTQA